MGLGRGVRRIEKRDGEPSLWSVCVVVWCLPTDGSRFVALLSHINGLLEDGAALTIVQTNLEGVGLFSNAIVLRGEQVDGAFHVEVSLIIAVDGFIIHEGVFLACGDRARIVGHDFNQTAVEQVFVDTARNLCQVNGEVGFVHDTAQRALRQHPVRTTLPSPVVQPPTPSSDVVAPALHRTQRNRAPSNKATISA